MNRIRDYKIMPVRGMEYSTNDINKLTLFKGESLRHFTVKAVLFHQLRKLKHDVISEVEIPGLGVGDLIDLTLQIHYEIEFTQTKSIRDGKADKYKRTGFDVIVIDCRKIPDDFKGMQKFLDPYIVVD